MKTKLLFSIVAFVVALSGITAAVARDTDVYLMAPTSASDDAPNVLIIFDNSGSMQYNSITTREPYIPATNYCSLTGAPSNVACDRIYWSFSGSPPSTGTDQWFAATKNHCEDSKTVLTDTGFYSGTKIIGFRTDAGKASNNGWRTLNNRVNSDLVYVDCKMDGANIDGYAQASVSAVAQAYTATQTKEFNWGNFTSSASPTLYSGNYLSYWYNSTLSLTQTRLQIAKTAMKSVVDANRGVRFGLMAFNVNGTVADGTGDDTNGGRVIMKIDSMDDARRTAMKAAIDGLKGETWTPLSETLWEARQYVGGLAVDYGDDASNPNPARDLTAELSGKYITPFKYACQKTFIVYMTDGDPTQDTDADAAPRIKGLSGLSTNTCQGNSGLSCLKDLAKWMHENDVVANNILPGVQTVTTYTIGFGSGISTDGKTLLQTTASNGGGKYYAADDANQLVTAFQSALTEIFQTNASFSSPSLSVNAFNRLFNNDDVFFALFKPSGSVNWDGNTKKFKLCNTADTTTYKCTFGTVIDKDGKNAIGADGKIMDTAKSYWGTAADGANITYGGAGAQIPSSATRNLYTYRGTYSSMTATVGTQVKAVVGNALYDAVITDPTVLGLPAGSTTAQVDELVNWMLSRDSYDNWTRTVDKYEDNSNKSFTDDRWAFADPLHSRPIAVTFGAELTAGKPDPTKPITKLFVGTNDGVVRMLSNDSGKEEWAFIVKEKLADQYNLSQNPDGAHVYGVDATPTFWINDKDGDGVIESGDKVYMYIGMRRGGRNIYAFDVTPSTTMTSKTDTVTPKLMWVIEGGTGDYAKLGQTWSRPLLAPVRLKCTGGGCGTGDSVTTPVLVFAGGYDEDQDNTIVPPADDMGNAIYVVNPSTGNRLWWASSDAGASLTLAGMDYSMPSDLTLMDSNADGAVDRIYVGDMGGQLWRIDLGTQLDAVGSAKGYVFADVGCSGDTRANNCAATTNQNRRKFFYPPEIAQVKDPDFSSTSLYDMVAVGSGNREDPLDLLTTNLTTGREAVHNRIYAFRDYNYKTGAPASTPTPLTDNATGGNLYDATANKLGTLTGAALKTEIDTKVKVSKGWYIDLREPTAITLPNGLTTAWVGEKVLAKIVIFGGVLFASTYVPANTVTQTTTCQASEGEARVYQMNYLDATPVLDFTGDGTKDRYKKVGGGIPSEVVIVIREGGTTGLVGTSGGAGGVTPPNITPWDKTYWYED